MADASDQLNQTPPTAGEEEDILLLTDVVEAPPSEVVLEIAPEEQELDSLFFKESTSQEPPPQEPRGEDEVLDDLLASLKDVPEDLGAPAIPPTGSETQLIQEGTAPLPGIEETVRREVESFLSEAEFKALVTEVLEETVEKISREILPQLAREVMDRKVAGLLQRLTQESE